MTIRYVYKNKIIANGFSQFIPHEGNFFEIQLVDKIFVVANVMFRNLSNGDVEIIVYLVDTTPEKTHQLRNYK